MRRKSLTAAAAGLLMTVSMTLGACALNQNPVMTERAPKEEASVSAKAEGTVTAVNEDGSKITFPLEEKVELTAYVYASNTGGGTMQDNYVTDWIEEQTNVKINFLYDLDGDEAKTKLNLIMSDPKSMPDIFLTTGWTKSELTLYGKHGLILPLNDYLEEAENWNRVNEIAPLRRQDLTMADGKIYSFGSAGECFHCLYQNRMWIYKPWVDQLCGGKMPETLEEVYDYLVAVRDQDPNGNGIADEIPLSGRLGGWATDPTVWFINSFIQCNNPLSNTNPTIGAGLVVKDGQVQFQFVDEQYKEAMSFLNKLYAEGLLDSQVFTQDETLFSAQLNSEEHLVGMHPGGMMQCDVSGLGVGPGEYQDWVVLEPVAGPGGVRLAAKGLDSYYANCRGVISRNCENPEVAVALFDWLLSEEATWTQAYGPEGVTWEFADAEDAAAGGFRPWREIIASKEQIDWASIGSGKSYENVVWPSDVYICNATTAAWAVEQIDEPEYSLKYILFRAAEQYDQYSPDNASLIPDIPFDEEAAKEITDFSLTIGGYVNQATVQFITGAVDIETGWDSFVEKLYAMGLEEYLQVYQDGYDRFLESLK